MAYSEKELVAIGRRFSTQRMIEQMPVSLAVARQYQSVLGAMFPESKVDEIESRLGKIRALLATQNEKKHDAATGNVPVGEALSILKEEIRDIIAIADNTFEEEPELKDEFHKGGPLGRSVPKVVQKSENVITLATKNKAPMAEWGLDDEKIQASQDALAQLIKADTEQEQAVRSMPPATRELYVEKARAYLLLKKLVRVGRRKFSGNPTIAAKFSNEILYRSGGKGPTTE